MSHSKRELIETLVGMIEEDELRAIVESVIEARQAKLRKLQQLSLKLSGESNPNESEGGGNDDGLTASEADTASTAVERILREATKPLGNGEIRKQYEALYGKSITSSAVGNALWKGKKKKLFKKVGATGSPRYTKWKYVKQDE